ncbi:MAG: 50S ribosomal protein L21e [Candidatus Micrarchaeota archaeon]
MVRRSKGLMSKKTKKIKSCGRFTVSRLTKSFSIGDKVGLDTQPYFSGMSSLRYKGAIGKIVSKRGSSYVVEIKDGNMKKNLVLHPIHLKQL